MTRVTPDLRRQVLQRDGQCVLAILEPGHLCRDTWGRHHASTALDLLSLEHVKDQPRMGRRAPSDPAHLVAMCHWSNVNVPSKDQRTAIREYLRRVTA